MQARILTLSLVIALSFAAKLASAGPTSCAFDPADHQEYAQTPTAGFDTGLFLAKLKRKLTGKVMGYSMILTNASGEMLVEVGYGYAQNPCEKAGAVPFTTNTKARWGSVSKMITAAAVLHRLEHNPSLTLETKMKALLPTLWQPSLHPSFEPVSLSLLLQHKGGFAASAGKDEDGNKLPMAARLINGVETEEGVGTRSYANASLGVFGFMGALWNLPAMAVAEAQFFENPLVNYNDYVEWKAKTLYYGYAQANILLPLGIDATCNLSAFNDPALLYSGPQDTQGKLTGEKMTEGCAAGGWVMSAAEMASFIHTLVHGSELLSPDTYALMEAQGGETDDRLGWGASIWQLNDGTALHQNGIVSGARAEVARYPNGFTVVAVANSPPSEGSLGGALKVAYNAAVD